MKWCHQFGDEISSPPSKGIAVLKYVGCWCAEFDDINLDMFSGQRFVISFEGELTSWPYMCSCGGLIVYIYIKYPSPHILEEVVGRSWPRGFLNFDLRRACSGSVFPQSG